jgi:two-component system CheB/CheR fusion protein
MKKFNPANEELQSANEELETTKEELQSPNEELQQRNGILAQTSNDLTNLLNSVNLPLLMLNNDLQIRQFTPLTQRLMNIRASDIGLFDKALTPRGRHQACAPMCGIPGLGF